VPDESISDQLERAQRRNTWLGSPNFKAARRASMLIQGGFTVFAVIIFLASFAGLVGNGLPKYTPAQYIGMLFCIAYVLVGLRIGRSYVQDKKRRFDDQFILEKYGNLGEQEAQLLDEGQLRLGALWRLTEQRLKLYHEIATRQAQTSFRNAQWAIGAGFVVIVGGACGAFFAKNITVTVVVGILGASGAALSAYIGRTFLRLQENAASHLRSYFDQPQEQFRYLAAERLLVHLDSSNQKADAVDHLVRAIILSGTSEAQKLHSTGSDPENHGE